MSNTAIPPPAFKSLSNEPDRFKLRLEPDGVYRVDGRVIPVRDETARDVGGVDNGESVVGVKCLGDMMPSGLGGLVTMDIE